MTYDKQKNTKEESYMSYVIRVVCHTRHMSLSSFTIFKDLNLLACVGCAGARGSLSSSTPRNRSLEKPHWPPKNQPPTSHYLRINLNKSFTLNTWSGLFHIFSKSFHLLICLICSFCSTNWRNKNHTTFDNQPRGVWYKGWLSWKFP